MGRVYATGKRALGLCDRCGQTFLLSELKFQIYNQINTNMKVCPYCLDQDQPQLQVGRWPVYDPQALHLPRPDLDAPGYRAFFGWNPVVGAIAYCAGGTVLVATT